MTERFCTTCGTQIAPDTKFCTTCGSPVAGSDRQAAERTIELAPTLDVTRSIQAASQSKPGGHSRWALLVGGVAIAALVGGAVYGLMGRSDGQGASASASVSKPAQAPSPAPSDQEASSSVRASSQPTPPAVARSSGMPDQSRAPATLPLPDPPYGQTWQSLEASDGMEIYRATGSGHDTSPEFARQVYEAVADAGADSDLYSYGGRQFKSNRNQRLYTMRCSQGGVGTYCVEVGNEDGGDLDAAVYVPFPDFD